MPLVTVAALPVMLMPQVPLAPEPVVEGTFKPVCAVACVVPPVPPLATAIVVAFQVPAVSVPTPVMLPKEPAWRLLLVTAPAAILLIVTAPEPSALVSTA